jgi:uncharacterized protein (TIGR02266 family)
MNPEPSKEKRLYPRKPIHTQVVFENEDGEGSLYFFSKDISAGGIFLEGDYPVEVGAQVFLRFSLNPRMRPIQATGEVIRVMRDRLASGKERLGIGIKFLYLHPLDRELIDNYIQTRP